MNKIITFIMGGHHDVEVLRVWDGLVQQEVDDPVVHLPGQLVSIVDLNLELFYKLKFYQKC